jgi:hypothetical protein
MASNESEFKETRFRGEAEWRKDYRSSSFAIEVADSCVSRVLQILVNTNDPTACVLIGIFVSTERL